MCNRPRAAARFRGTMNVYFEAGAIIDLAVSGTFMMQKPKPPAGGGRLHIAPTFAYVLKELN